MEENNKDRGQSVREKAKHLVILLQDEEKLKSERMRAMKAKERLAQNATGFGSDGSSVSSTSFTSDLNSQECDHFLSRNILVLMNQSL